MPRLFSGIEIPEAIGYRMSLLRTGLTGARWIDPANYHITLRFIGDVDGGTARDFAANLGRIEAAPFQLQFDGLGSFGGKKPRAIWAALRQSEALLNLQRAHERAARLAGLPAEPRNFIPHVTIARLRNTKPISVAAYLEAQAGGFWSQSFTVDRFVLFSSRASIGGGPYVVEAEYPLEHQPADYPLGGAGLMG